MKSVMRRVSRLEGSLAPRPKDVLILPTLGRDWCSTGTDAFRSFARPGISIQGTQSAALIQVAFHMA
jgi:hypothetical protein